MKSDPIGFDIAAQPDSVVWFSYCGKMDEPDISAVIWENVRLLMNRKYRRENLTQFGNETGISNGGAQRLKAKADVGVRLLEKVAKKFDIDAWQLLAPNLGASMLLTDAELEAIRRMRNPLQPRGSNIAALPPPPDSGVRRIAKMPTKKKRSNPKRGPKRA